MRLLKDIHRLPIVISYLIRKHIDLVICVFFPVWVFCSVLYHFYYDEYYVKYALEIMHYSDLSVFSFIPLFGLYGFMKDPGRITMLGWFAVLGVNTYQLHRGFSDKWYCIFWLGFIYLFMIICYLFTIAKYYNQMFNHKNYK